MSASFTRPCAYALLLVVWGLDALTPQPIIVAIFLNVPIALSSLLLDPRLTRNLIVFALIADVSAGYADAALSGHHWDVIAVVNRVVAGFSFLLVGGLSIAAQRSARRAGELRERSEREARERRVREAVERMRGSMSVELIERSLVREAGRSLGADLAWYYTRASGLQTPTVYRWEIATGEVEVGCDRSPAPIASLVQRVFDEGRIVRVAGGDPLGRLVLDTLGVAHALAMPLAEHALSFGVLVIARYADDFDADAQEGLRYYADQATIALSQGRLFAELARRNEELARANAATTERGEVIRDIVYALSHDLRTPLSAASMTMHQALEGRYGALPQAYREVLKRSVQSNDALRRLAETLLLVSCYEAGEASRRREIVALRAIARDAVDELESLWRGKSITLAMEGCDVAVSADRAELRRAAINLLANAVAWTPSGGTIVVRTAWVDGRARLTVEDTGFGVPPEMREQLFARIGGASRHGAGSGLGLYIVRRIAEGHGGSVTYEPRVEGGSIFALELPLAADPHE